MVEEVAPRGPRSPGLPLCNGKGKIQSKVNNRYGASYRAGLPHLGDSGGWGGRVEKCYHEVQDQGQPTDYFQCVEKAYKIQGDLLEAAGFALGLKG